MRSGLRTRAGAGSDAGPAAALGRSRVRGRAAIAFDAKESSTRKIGSWLGAFVLDTTFDWREMTGVGIAWTADAMSNDATLFNERSAGRVDPLLIALATKQISSKVRFGHPRFAPHQIFNFVGNRHAPKLHHPEEARDGPSRAENLKPTYRPEYRYFWCGSCLRRREE